jgi:hypothetical protein
MVTFGAVPVGSIVAEATQVVLVAVPGKAATKKSSITAVLYFEAVCIAQPPSHSKVSKWIHNSITH